MEAQKIVRVTCTMCGAVGEAPIWDRIDAQNSKSDARHVRNETLFEVTCSRCGHKMSLNYPLMYHDGGERFFIQYVTSDEAQSAAEQTIRDEARGMAREAALAEDGSVGALDDGAGALDGYRLRIVRSRNALREKIVVFRNGLDDRVVEVLKLTAFNMAKSQRALKGATGAYFGGVSKAGDVSITFTGGRRHRETVVPAALYADVLADVEARSDGSELTVDRAWAERFLEKTQS